MADFVRACAVSDVADCAAIHVMIGEVPVADLRERLNADIDAELAEAQRAGAEVLRGRAS